MKIYASKQVGMIYYMVDDIAILCTIVNNQVIKTSNKPEKGYSDGSSHHYVSFLRSLDKAGRNKGRWKYGLKIDGTKLSNKYKIVPYSFAGNAVISTKRKYRVKYLSAYDDGTYVLQLVDWPVMSIPKFVYDDIAEAIEQDVEGINSKKKLTISSGKRAYRGRTVLNKYLYDVPTGGTALNDDTISKATFGYLLKPTNLNETEERIWVLDSNIPFISMKDCIVGYIEPSGDASVEEAIARNFLPKKMISHY